MKKLVRICTTLLLLITILCGYAKTDSSCQFAEKFIKTYFTISDYSKMKDYDTAEFINLYTNHYSKPIKNLMTAQAYKLDLNNRRHISLVTSAASAKINTKVDKIKITKTEFNKDGSVFYDYNASLNFVISGKKQLQKFSGQVAVKKTNKVWKVTNNWYDTDIIKLIQKYSKAYAKTTPSNAIGIKNKQLTINEKLEDFEYMYTVLKENYPFFEVNKRLNGIDWLNKKDEYINRIKSTYDDRDFYYALMIIFSDLKNGHTNIIEEDSFQYYMDVYSKCKSFRQSWFDELNKPKALQRYEYKSENTQQNTTLKRELACNVKTEVLKDGEVAYLGINSFNTFLIDPDMKVIKPFLTANKDAKTLIIDLRGNGGGDTSYWSDNLVPLLTNKPLTTNEFFIYRGGTFSEKFNMDSLQDQYSKLQPIDNIKNEGMTKAPPELIKDFKCYYKVEYKITPKDPIGFKGKIYIITDKQVYSAADAFATFAKHSGFATLVGETTGGDGIGTDPIICMLPNSGYIFRFSSIMGLTADGTCDEEFKTEPDIKASTAYTFPLVDSEVIQTILKSDK